MATKLTLRQLDPAERPAWERLRQQHAPENFLQDYRWGEFKQWLNQDVVRYGFYAQEQMVGLAQVLVESHWLKGTTGILSRGPVFAELEPEMVGFATDLLVRELKKQGLSRLVIEPPLGWPESVALSKSRPCTPRQPHRTRMLTLTDDESLLAEFKSKTRYNVRLAERKGVTLKHGSDRALLEELLPMLRATEDRQSISLYSDDYFHTLLDVFGPSGDAEVLIAEHEGTPLAGMLLLTAGPTAIYLFGGTSDQKRELMGSQCLHFDAMRHARAKGCTHYDFWGIALEGDANFDHWQGISRFKAGFGGEITTYPDAVEIVFSQGRDWITRLARRFV